MVLMMIRPPRNIKRLTADIQLVKGLRALAPDGSVQLVLAEVLEDGVHHVGPPRERRAELRLASRLRELAGGVAVAGGGGAALRGGAGRGGAPGVLRPQDCAPQVSHVQHVQVVTGVDDDVLRVGQVHDGVVHGVRGGYV